MVRCRERCDDLPAPTGVARTFPRVSGLSQVLGIHPSVGRARVCWDNAEAESFTAALKNAREYRTVCLMKEKAIEGVASWDDLRQSSPLSLSRRISCHWQG